jgi:hypothetical protein
MEERKEEGEAEIQEHGPEHWFSKWERQCLAEAEQDEQLPPELQEEAAAAAQPEHKQQKLWHLFQNSATAVAQLYKGEASPPSWPGPVQPQSPSRSRSQSQSPSPSPSRPGEEKPRHKMAKEAAGGPIVPRGGDCGQGVGGSPRWLDLGTLGSRGPPFYPPHPAVEIIPAPPTSLLVSRRRGDPETLEQNGET